MIFEDFGDIVYDFRTHPSPPPFGHVAAAPGPLAAALGLQSVLAAALGP